MDSEQQPPETPETKRSFSDCPTCGAPVSPFVTSCPYCGGDVARRSKWRARKLRTKRKFRQLRSSKPKLPSFAGFKGLGSRSSGASSDTPYAVGILILANIFSYLAFDLNGDLFSDPGALSADSVRAGDWYRLLTYQFLHSGFLELLFSVLLIAAFAVMLEQCFGHFATLSIYVLSGLVAGLVVVLLDLNGVLAGSLVSTLGLMGAWLALVARPGSLQQSYPLSAALILVTVIFLYGSIQQNISAAVLLAGLAAGAVLSLVAARAS